MTSAAPGERPPRRAARRRRMVLAACLLALSSAIVFQSIGPNQTAHYATVRALAAGTARIHHGDTGDAALVHGHYYSAKAPGLALFTFPWYEGLRAAGLDSAADERTAIWKLSLFGVVLPFFVLLLLVAATVERVVPGYGAATAVLVGAGSLVFPFSTLFFDHVLSATLGFSAFVVLQFERRHTGERLWLLAAGGVLAGIAVVVEFPLVVVAGVLGLVFVPGARALVRLGAYGAGVLAGMLPLGAFNLWAFGSPTTISYAHALGGNNKRGLWGVGFPHFHAALTLLLANKGLFVLTPVTAAALVGLPRLWRAGFRREALASAAIGLVFLIWNAGYDLPFGGSTPGPRFLVPTLPFLALPLATALRARPLLVAGVGVVSASVMWAATATEPMVGDEGIGHWLGLVGRGKFGDTVLTELGVHDRWASVLPFAFLFAAGLALALVSVPAWHASRAEAALLVGALLSWVVVAVVVPPLVPLEGRGTDAGTLAALVLVAALAAGLFLAARQGAVMLLALLPAAALTIPRATAHPRWSLLIAALTLCFAVAVWTGAASSSARRLRARVGRASQAS